MAMKNGALNRGGKRLRGVCTFAMLVLVIAGRATAAPELLISGFGGDVVARVSLSSGASLGALAGASVNGPQAVRLGPDGLLYLANEEDDNVLRFDPATMSFVDVFVTGGSGGLDGPTGLDFGPDGNLYVGSFNTNAVLEYDGGSGAFVGTFVPSATGGLNGPDVGLIFGPDGNLYIPSFWNNRILRYDGTTGAFIDIFINGGLTVMPQPRTLVFRPDGRLYVTSDSGNRVVRFNATTGAFIDVFVDPGAGGLSGASGLVFGNDGFVYVSSWRNDQVLKMDAITGDYVSTVTSGVIDGPTFLYLHDPPPPVPAASTWGLAVLSLGLLIAGSIRLAHRNPSTVG